jgi:hypothetical protein
MAIPQKGAILHRALTDCAEYRHCGLMENILWTRDAIEYSHQFSRRLANRKAGGNSVDMRLIFAARNHHIALPM